VSPAPTARWRFTRVCAVTRGERAFRAAMAVFVGAFAVSVSENLWCAIPAAVGAITGWCPTNLLPTREARAEQNALGFPEARQRIDV
jgi:hypothetical protein